MPGGLLADLYELNMAASYLRRPMTGMAAFSVFVRRLPAVARAARPGTSTCPIQRTAQEPSGPANARPHAANADVTCDTLALDGASEKDGKGFASCGSPLRGARVAPLLRVCRLPVPSLLFWLRPRPKGCPHGPRGLQ